MFPIGILELRISRPKLSPDFPSCKQSKIKKSYSLQVPGRRCAWKSEEEIGFEVSGNSTLCTLEFKARYDYEKVGIFSFNLHIYLFTSIESEKRGNPMECDHGHG